MQDIIRFPIRRRIIDKLGIDPAISTAAIDEELREIEKAIAALKARRRVLLLFYRESAAGVVALILAAFLIGNLVGGRVINFRQCPPGQASLPSKATAVSFLEVSDAP